MHTLDAGGGDGARLSDFQPDPVQFAVWLDDGGRDLPEPDSDPRRTHSRVPLPVAHPVD